MITRRSWTAAAAAALAAGPLARARAQTLVPIKLGHAGNETNAEAYYAQDSGIFTKNGLSVELQAMRGGAAVAAAISGGALQAGSSNTLSLAVSRARGLPFLAIAPGATYDTNKPTSMIAVKPDGPVHGGRDLNGQIVGGISIGGIDNLAMLSWIDKNGGEASTVKFVEIPPVTVADALEAGRIAASTLPEPYLTAQARRIRTIGKSYDGIAPFFELSLWIADGEWANKNPAVTRALASSLVQGAAWAWENPNRAAAILSKYTSQPVDHIRQETAKTLEPGQIQPMLDGAYKYKLLPRQMRAAEIIWTGR
jgi:NitT/TauT family transport system substrate-binding protein